MSNWTRRAFLVASGAGVAACARSTGGGAGSKIDYRTELALQQMYEEIPGSQDLADRAAGMLVMPSITKAGFGFGGAYGEGALLIGGAPVDYYSTIQANWGLQIGAQQFAHTLFFMNEDALAEFRGAKGWAVGADAAYVLRNKGDTINMDTTKLRSPVIAVIYGRAGLQVGATLEGTKYSRIVR